jgi:DNA-binding winged helix-turn-helix (wHTH) protein/tetratricopeptide (TPR) repeat protein
MEFRWNEWRLDVDARVLARSGVPTPVAARVFDLLVLLLRNRGRIVSDVVLRRELWTGVTVSDASLRQLLKEARRAIGDDGNRQTHIQTVRGRGVRWLPPVSGDAAETVFVGREDVIGELERELERVESGSGRLTLISGSAGIGKTSTLAEIAARAEARGWRVAKGWARAGAESAAYALWADVVEALGASAPTAAGVELPASSGISESNRFARFRSVERAIARSARERPLLVALDDLQFADRESLALLRFLAPALREARAWILGTHRPLAAGDVATRDLAALSADGATRTIELRGLHAGEIRALIALHLRTPLNERASGALARRTGGSPLLALEVARALSAEGAVLDDAHPRQIEERVELGLAPLLRRRLGALAPVSRRLLQAAAAIGDVFEPELARAAAGCSRKELERALGEAERVALVEREAEQTWRFSHPLFAEALVRELAEHGASAAMHERLYEALAARGEADAFRIATHALGARERVDPGVRVACLRRAAAAAWRIQALADAETWQRRAIEVAETVPLPPLDLCDLYQELGELALGASGLIAARASFDRAARLARDAGDAMRLTRAALGHAHRAFVLGATDSVLDWLRAAHASPSGDPALEARVSARLGVELLIASGSHAAEAEDLIHRGLAGARRVGDALTLGRVLCDVAIARFGGADLRGELATAHEIVSCGQQAGDIEIEFRGLTALATALLESGDRAGVDSALVACEHFVARFPSVYARAVTRGIAAMVALLDGRSDAAEAAIADSERDIRSTGSLGLLLVAGLQRYSLARQRGDLERALPLLDQARVRFPGLIGLSAMAGVAHGILGNTEAARDAADLVLGRLDALPHDRSRLPTLVAAAELSYLAGSRRLADSLAPLLAPFAGLHAVTGNAAVYFGCVSHALGFVAAVQGRRAQAIRHFEHAVRAHEAMGSPPWRERSAEALARIRRQPSVVKLVS